MRAISLWQPWASAIALGHKKIETRHWSTNYRGPLLIHAAKRWEKDQREFAAVELALGRLSPKIPLGAIVARCDLVDVKTTEELLLTIGPIEKIYGNYEPRRFGWILENIKPLREPIGATGRQGFFDYPEELLK